MGEIGFLHPYRTAITVMLMFDVTRCPFQTGRLHLDRTDTINRHYIIHYVSVNRADINSNCNPVSFSINKRADARSVLLSTPLY